MKKPKINLEDVKSFLTKLPFKSVSEKIFQDLIRENLPLWNSPKKTSSNYLTQLLLKEKFIKKYSILKDETQKQLYAWKTEDFYTIVSGLKWNSYFTFTTALFLNDLVKKPPKNNYLNFEHSESVKKELDITQDQIDEAFTKDQRITQNNFIFEKQQIKLTNSRFTNRLGVIKIEDEKKLFFYTDLERTLIDIVTRPAYSGGVLEILNTYRLAKGKVDLLKLSEYYKKMNFIYPYHQSIGFYLEKAGYSKEDQSLFERPMDFDFYLAYDMSNPRFSTKWRIYFPEEI